MKGQIEGQMNIFDFIPNPEQKEVIKAPDRVPPVDRYLRYGPHTLIPEVREETKNWLDKNGVPEWVTWDKNSVPCSNCTWFDGNNCCSGGHTNHYEYGYLICDGFYQSIVERKPSTVGDSFPSLKKEESKAFMNEPEEPKEEIKDDYIRENPTCFYVFGHYLDRAAGWHKVPDELPIFKAWTPVDVVLFGKKTGTSWMECDKWEAKDWAFRSIDDRGKNESVEVMAWKISDQGEEENDESRSADRSNDTGRS